MLNKRTQRAPSPRSTGRRTSLAAMSPDEQRTWIITIRAALVRKMQRERSYLDRRAARGTHTPTDEAYEADQMLESDLLALLDEMAQSLPEGVFS
jgi:hypothetical protein